MPKTQSPQEEAPMPGDHLVPNANVVSNAETIIDAPIETVYGYLAQMGRRDEGRGGWPMSASVERHLPEGKWALREVDPSLALKEGDSMGDWLAFGKPVVAQVVEVEAPHTLVFKSQRGKTDLSWALSLAEQEDGKTKLQTRLRLGSVEHPKVLSKAMVIDRRLVDSLGKGIEERHRGVTPKPTRRSRAKP